MIRPTSALAGKFGDALSDNMTATRARVNAEAGSYRLTDLMPRRTS